MYRSNILSKSAHVQIQPKMGNTQFQATFQSKIVQVMYLGTWTLYCRQRFEDITSPHPLLRAGTPAFGSCCDE